MNKQDAHYIDCPFCKSKEHKIIEKNEQWQVVSCVNCNYKFTNPQVKSEFIANYYLEEYFNDERHSKKFYNTDGSLKTYEIEHNRLEDIEHYAESRGNLLEIGSARGGFLGALQQRGWKVNGVEISGDASKLANDNGVKTFCGIIEDYETDLKFDLICMYQTLEHVVNPKTTLHKCSSLLNQNGLLVIEVPNNECFEMKYSKKRRFLSYDLPRHYSHFSPDFLTKELELMGFEVLEIKLFPNPIFAKVLGYISKLKSNKTNKKLNTKPTDTSSEKPLQKITTGRFTKYINKVNQFVPGWRFTIIAKKKT